MTRFKENGLAFWLLCIWAMHLSCFPQTWQLEYHLKITAEILTCYQLNFASLVSELFTLNIIRSANNWEDVANLYGAQLLDYPEVPLWVSRFFGSFLGSAMRRSSLDLCVDYRCTIRNGFVFGKQFGAQSKLVLPQLQSRQGSTVCHSSLALHNAIYVFQKHRLSKQCQSFKSKVKGI